MRDPIQRIESQIAHNIAAGRSSSELLLNAFETSRYFTQLRQYDEVGLANEILLLDFHELCMTPEIVLERIWGHLDLKCVDFYDLPNLNVRKISGKFLSIEQEDLMRRRLQNEINLLRTRYGFFSSFWGQFD